MKNDGMTLMVFGNVIIFGLSVATLLTLLIIPLMYELLEGRTN